MLGIVGPQAAARGCTRWPTRANEVSRARPAVRIQEIQAH